MDSGKTLEARLLGKNNVVYGCAVLVLCTCCICDVVNTRFYVYVGYAVMCTYGVVHMLDMWCYVHMVLHTCWICGAMYI